ncbi:MAG: ATP-dependent RecD-like DNA helicase [Lachnospiraceae bacterium]|nr:ATP-dependent RecD-like DNA helicase [Lachnospiraceae bacterium]
MVELKGYIDHIIFHNEENGYTVFVFRSEGEEYTCVGNFQGIAQGENMLLTGQETEHSVYGQQIRVETWKIVTPEDAAGIERYLGSGAIKGIGPALAARIVKKFGEDTFRIIEEEPERLAEVKGISMRGAREIGQQIEEKKGMREAMIFLQQYGISNTLAVKIYDTYGMQVYQVLRENPYRLVEDIFGVGFKLADEIAFRTGIRMDSDYRIRSGILYTLLLAGSEGHVYLPQSILLRNSSNMLEIPPETIEIQIRNLAMEKKLVIRQEQEEIRCYAASWYYMELGCAGKLAELNLSMTPPKEEAEEKERAETIRQRIEDLEHRLDISLDELQREAVLQAVSQGVFILTGGPGTGKTTTINMILRYFEQEGMDILLAAPTGRAAKRMSEATGFEAKTIHRMLELGGELREDDRRLHFFRNEENPLEADVVIIDEMSMVDLALFQALLRAVSVGTQLILVGDVNQLPSVGPGCVLQDLIASGVFPVVMLRKIFRQAEESDIVVNAHRIYEGKPVRLDNKSRDFFFLERKDVQVIYKHMIQLISQKLPPYLGVEPQEIQVLTPMRKGALGVQTLNRILQQHLNPPAPHKEEHSMGERVFRVGDKVMQIRNNYQLEWEIVSRYHIPVDRGIGVFNGDTGIIREIRQFDQTLLVEFDDMRRVEYAFSMLEELELAYAVTIHKAQGSEYPAVILPLLSGPALLLNRNLLYTAVTRARQCVTILGSSETLGSMIENKSEHLRYSGLGQRIREQYHMHEEGMGGHI